MEVSLQIWKIEWLVIPVKGGGGAGAGVGLAGDVFRFLKYPRLRPCLLIASELN